MHKRFSVAILTTCIALLGTVHVEAGGPVPGNSNAFGKSLGEWMKLYWSWAYGAYPEDGVGKVKFLPVPAGEPVDPDCPFIFAGEEAYTMKTGEKFVLPVFVYIGEEYTDGSQDDPSWIPPELFTGADVFVTLDGEPIIDSETEDISQYFFDTEYFDSVIYYDEPSDYGSTGAVWVKGLGFAHNPLPKGVHVLSLYIDTGIELDPENFPGCTLTWINSWLITVE